MHESSKKHLEQEIATQRDEMAQMRQTISQLEREKDRLLNDAAAQQAKLVENLEEVKIIQT